MKNKKMFLILIPIVAIGLIFLVTGKENTSVIIKYNEQEIVLEKDYLYSHEDAILFPVVVRSSGEKPVEAQYKGIELLKLFNSLDLDILSFKKITFNATDGYRIILSINELLEPSNTYLTFERDGEYLKSRKQKGNGPYQLIIRRDPFSQRWIKHVDSIILE